MTRSTCTFLVLAFLGASAAQARLDPPPSVQGKVDKYNVDKNFVLIRTSPTSVLPPLVVGRDIKFIVDGKEVANLKDLKADDLRKLANRRVEVIFREEGKRHVADTVKCLPEK
jgi:hypothetical protein